MVVKTLRLHATGQKGMIGTHGSYIMSVIYDLVTSDLMNGLEAPPTMKIDLNHVQ